MDEADLLFVRAIENPADFQGDPTRWLKVGRGYYFVLRKCTAEESAALTEALGARPDAFVLTDTGNVRCRKGDGSFLELHNPLDANETKTYDLSVEELRALSPQYRYDERSVISRNLHFILHRDDGGVWHLLYNPLHRSAFRAQYEAIMASAPAHLTQWGATTLRTDAHMNLRELFDNYCDAFHVGSGASAGYLDPTCNIVRSAAQCRASSFFFDNRVQHDARKVRRNQVVLDKLAMGEPAYCLCMGKPYSYVKDNLTEESSFVYAFEGLKRCKQEFNINVCSIELSGGRQLNVEGSSLSAQCGGGDPWDVDASQRDDPPAPGPPAPDPPADGSSLPVALVVATLAVVALLLMVIRRQRG